MVCLLVHQNPVRKSAKRNLKRKVCFLLTAAAAIRDQFQAVNSIRIFARSRKELRSNALTLSFKKNGFLSDSQHILKKQALLYSHDTCFETNLLTEKWQSVYLF